MKLTTIFVFLLAWLGITTCGNSPTDSDTSSNASKVEKLSFFEEELLGLWSRYHGYDGSMNYIRFNADRTACDWEEANGSEYRKDKGSFSYWDIDEKNPIKPNRFKVIVQGAGIYYTFDYPTKKIWPENYTNLLYSPSAEAKICE